MIDADLEVAVQVFHPGAVDVGAFEEDDEVKAARRDLSDRDLRTSGIWEKG